MTYKGLNMLPKTKVFLIFFASIFLSHCFLMLSALSIISKKMYFHFGYIQPS